MRHLTTTLHIVAALTLTTVTTFAQDPTPPPAPNEVPLDGFSALLLAAGHAARHVYRNNKRNTPNA